MFAYATRKESRKEKNMSDYSNETLTNDIEIIARAAQQVPGFSSMMWLAARNLYEARNAAKEMREYKASHAKPSGSAYARLVRKQAERAQAFCTSTDMISLVLESLSLEYEYTGLLFEVEQLAEHYSKQISMYKL